MGPNYIIAKGFACGGAIRQFRCVELTDYVTVAEVNNVTDKTLGVCQDEIPVADATAGRYATIWIMGITRAIAGAAITTVGTRLKVDNQGRVIPVAAGAGTTENTPGVALTTATAAGEHIDMLLTPYATITTPV
jgi:hypothetical protein